MSSVSDLAHALSTRGRRPAGSDAERRTAVWLSEQINANHAGRAAEIETFWCRPSWVTAQVSHILVAVGGSLLAPTQSKIGAALVVLALLCMVADWTLAISPGRLLSRERASQNVVSQAPEPRQVTLVLTAGYDSARLNLDRNGSRLPGWLFWLVLVTAALLATTLVRVEQVRVPAVVAVLQTVATVLLVLAAGALLVLNHSNEDGTGAATAIALARTLDVAPPANLGVELVLTGAASTYGLGLRRHLRARRRRMRATNTVVLGFGGGADAAAGAWYLASDGPLVPLGLFRELRRLAAQTDLLTEQVGRGCSAALPARMRQLPALSLGGDADALLSASLALVDGIDAYIGRVSGP
jgi:hypothetical protein